MGDPGTAIDKNGIFILKHVGYYPNAVLSHNSTNMGYSWSGAYSIYNGGQFQPEDKGSLATDLSSSSSFYGRTYITGVNYGQANYSVLFAYSTNSGVNWSGYSPINNPPPNRCSGGESL